MAMLKSLSSALKDPVNCHSLKLSIKEVQLPEDIFKLTQLSELYLEAPYLKELPSLLKLGKLKHFSLKAPAFTGSLNEFFYHPSLQYLKVAETPVSDFNFKLEKHMAPLVSLTLKLCEIKKLPLELGELTTLQELYLPGNQLKELPFTMPGLVKLKRLNLDSNCFEKFPDLVGHLPKLMHLSIDHNKFNEAEKARIQRQFNIIPN